MNVGDVLFAISEAGLTLTASNTQDTLKVYPAEKLTLEWGGRLRLRREPLLRLLPHRGGIGGRGL